MQQENRLRIFWALFLFIGGCTILIFAILFIQDVSQNLSFTPRPPAGATFPLEQKWSHNLSNSITDSVGYLSVGTNGTIYARTEDTLYSVQADTGDILWSFHLTEQVSTSPAMVAERKIYVEDDETLWALDELTGEVIWEQALSNKDARLVAASDTLVLVNLVSESILAYDAVSGDFLWRQPIGRGHIPAYLDKNFRYVPDVGIMNLDGGTGEILATFESDTIGQSNYFDGVIYYADRTNNLLVAFDVRQQVQLWRVDLLFSGFPEIKIIDEYVFVADLNTLYSFHRADGVLVWKVNASAPTNISIIGDRI